MLRCRLALPNLWASGAASKGRRWLSSPPPWVGELRDAEAADTKTSVNYDFRMKDDLLYEDSRYEFDPATWGGPEELSHSARAALCRGEPDKSYVCIGEAFAFADAQDNPVVNSPDHPARLWWDPAVTSEKVLVQLAPHFPPALWLPLKPSHDALKRLFRDFSNLDAVHLERYLPIFEEMQRKYEERSSVPLAESGNRFQAGDHFKDALRFGGVADLRRDYPLSATLYLGTAQHPVDVERRILGDPPNPSVFSWPLLVSSDDGSDVPAFSAFRTIYSKSMIVFITRMDWAATRDHPEGVAGCTEAPVFAYVSYPDMPRVTGGPGLVRRFNEAFKAEFPENVPVDVLSALWRFAPQGEGRLTARLQRMSDTLPQDALVGGTRDEQRHLQQVCGAVAGLAGVLANDPSPSSSEAFLTAAAPLLHRRDPQLLLALGNAYHSLGLSERLQNLRASLQPSLLTALESHLDRSRGLTRFSLKEHTLDTAARVVNPDFAPQSPEELAAQQLNEQDGDRNQ